jgi:hypothetical protein
MIKMFKHEAVTVLALIISVAGAALLQVGCLDEMQDGQNTSDELATAQSDDLTAASAPRFLWTASYISVLQPSNTIGPEVLDIRGVSTADRALAQLWHNTGVDNQTWDIWTSSTPGFYLLKNRHSGKCLDMATEQSPVVSGTRVQQWACNGGSQQDWQAGGSSGWVTLRNRHNLGSAVETNLCLDVSGPVYANGWALQVQDCAIGGWHQHWNIFP